MNIYQVLEAVRATSSKNEKLAILKANKDVPKLKNYLVRVYNPQYNYYIKKLPKPSNNNVYRGFDVVDILELAGVLEQRVFTGNEAIERVALALGAASFEQQKLLEWLLLRDVRAGISEDTVNKVWPGAIFIPPYMRCSSFSEKDLNKWGVEDGVYIQLKADGVFVNIIKEVGKAPVFMTRNGNTFPEGVFGNLGVSLENGFVYTGELLVEKELEGEWTPVLLDRQTGNGLINSCLKGGTLPEHHYAIVDLWDCIPFDDWKEGSSVMVYEDRLALLKENIAEEYSNASVVESHVVTTVEEVKQQVRQWMAEGYEGGVVKHKKMLWKDGTSKHQMKMKAKVVVELKAVALTEGSGKNADTFGSITCVSSDEKVVVDISGFTDAMRKEVKDNWENIYRNLIVSVKANSIVSRRGEDRYSLFLPRFEEWRFDKHEADTLEYIQDAFANGGFE